MILPKVGYYQNQVVRIENTNFILLSHITPVDAYFVWKVMNDYRQILYKGSRYATKDYKAEHQKCLAFITN